MDIERIREKIKQSQRYLTDALEELGDYSQEAQSVEDDYGRKTGDGSGKASKMQKILSLMED